MRSRGLWMISTAAALCAAAPAWAQDGGEIQDSNPQNAEAPAAGEEIIVTAQKRTENVRDIPATVNVLGGETLDQARVGDITDIVALVPGLEVGTSSGAQLGYVSLRGLPPQVFGEITEQVRMDFADGAVGVYLDACLRRLP